MDNLSTRTPAEIDGEIARLESEFARAQQQTEQAQDTINRIHNASSLERSYPWNSQERLEEAVAALNAGTAAQAVAREALYPLNAEYRRRPWNRYYLVTNTNGHVHSSTSCDTCFPTTTFAWLTEQSGMSHEDLVELAGETACTVCFPDAPVDVLKRKSALEAPERKAAREEREAKRAAKAAAEVTVEGYFDYSDRPKTKVFKTSRAVTNDIAAHLSSLAWYGASHPSAPQWVSNIEAARKALEAKGVAYDYDKALANARKKVTRDGGEPKY